MPQRDKLQKTTSENFTLQSLCKHEPGVKVLLDFARHIGLRYCKMVRYSSTQPEEQDEKKDEWQSEMGIDAFNG
jgi:hypothetical protein